MTDKIIVITSPDDVVYQGIRFLFVDLKSEQLQLLSNLLINSNHTNNVIVNYVWNVKDSLDWLFDKILKADHIFFNAESENQTIVGYLAGKRNSSYFGHLRDLNLVNTSVLNSLEDCENIFKKAIKNYE